MPAPSHVEAQGRTAQACCIKLLRQQSLLLEDICLDTVSTAWAKRFCTTCMQQALSTPVTSNAGAGIKQVADYYQEAVAVMHLAVWVSTSIHTFLSMQTCAFTSNFLSNRNVKRERRLQHNITGFVSTIELRSPAHTHSWHTQTRPLPGRWCPA